MYEFQATNIIVFDDVETDVMNVEGALYTKEEWENGDKADWELVDGALLFQGAVPICKSFRIQKKNQEEA